MSRIDNKASNSYQKWRSYDVQTQSKTGDLQGVDHAASARENAEDAFEGVKNAVTLPFIAPFMDDAILGGSVKGLGDRAANTVLATVMAPMLLAGGLKDGLDAAIHGIAALIDD